MLASYLPLSHFYVGIHGFTYMDHTQVLGHMLDVSQQLHVRSKSQCIVQSIVQSIFKSIVQSVFQAVYRSSPSPNSSFYKYQVVGA